MKTQAHLTEIFSSVQGEGPYVGARQIFARFYGCHRRCVFCDTPKTVTAWQPQSYKPSSFEFEQTPGHHDFKKIENPISIEKIIDIFRRLNMAVPHHSVAFTGGEPLLHADFLRELLPQVEHLGLRTYLETAGDLYHELDKLLPWLDIVAMDIKLPSVTQNEAAWGSHRHFLKRCIDNEIEVFAKAIVSRETSEGDLRSAIDVVAETSPETLFILQPLTPFGEAKNPPRPEQLLEWQKIALEKLPNVRVIPQCHKMMGQL